MEPRAYFVAPGAPPAERMRRLLLISYHFPPASTAGALRWRKLASLAAERRWALDVVSADPGPGGPRSGDGLNELPGGTRVFGVPTPALTRDRIVSTVLRSLRGLREPRVAPETRTNGTAALQQAATPVDRRPGVLRRTYGALYDNALHAGWATGATGVGSRLATEHRYDAVISCGPPHAAHVAARDIASRHGLPLIVDLRDPWRLVERLADSIDSPVWRWRAAWQERSVVPGASLIVMNTEPARDAMRAQYPASAGKIIAVMNGYDDEAVPTSTRERKFVITYTGSIYLDRDPRPLFEAARRLIARRGLLPADFGITLVGSVASGKNGSTAAMVTKLGVESYVDILPHRPRAELFQILCRSAMLLSLAQDSHMAIPSKLYEYMQFDAWILALAEPYSAPARLLAGSAADVVRPEDIDGLSATLEKRYDEYRRGAYPVRLASDDRFSRRSQAKILFDALERCTAAPLAVV